MDRQKFNGYAKWAIVVIAISTIIYNTIVTNVIVKNDLKHFGLQIEKVEERVETIYKYLLEENK